MVSPAVNVVRYSALFSGIVYGFVHRRTLQAQFDSDAARQELHKREQWLEQAKKAWQAKVTKNDGLITDPDAPGFDLEAVLKSLE
ncbi:hypothetical protein MVLG_04831 [Microbotryum lychnidis-dioicae p1A1 Lamole]|uniref:ATP synthase F(0) complex subunit e, mitochondrial n=1 Tax=Microbotryum lychnidis-dioicae (strain p1A1 Lamole / MvSl-1064) TaxID=683840 RepID=U5HCE9_USTV1|nr:hypothetical protein MVLG_04831 [Microbotryum lychnidis-dioicae p1A1 Lamole]|eukprot:KDE04777.1 hypothetical protein MVLG_04831 [Microbotryum lychnidis-dioicae p1A1 Lamole]